MFKRRPRFLALLVCFLLTCTFTTTTADAWMGLVAPVLAISSAAVGGPGVAQLTIELSAEHMEVFLAEPLRITVRVRNVSRQEVAIPVSWEADYFSLHVTRDGKTRNLNWSPFSAPVTLPVHRLKVLRRGQVYTRAFEFVQMLKFEEAGKYTLRARLDSKGKVPYVDPKTGLTHFRPCWKGTVSSTPLTIQVKPLTDPKDRAALKVIAGKEAIFRGLFVHIWYARGRTEPRFRKVLEKYPESLFAKHCEYALAATWTGYLKNPADVAGAIRQYTRVTNKYPPFTFTDDAELALAKIYAMRYKRDRNKEDRTKAIRHLRNVVEKYPRSDSVPEAEDLIRQIVAHRKWAPRFVIAIPHFETTRFEEAHVAVTKTVGVYRQILRDLSRQLVQDKLSSEAKVHVIDLLGELRATGAVSALIDRIDLRIPEVDQNFPPVRWGSYPAREALRKIGMSAVAQIVDRLGGEEDHLRRRLMCYVVADVEGKTIAAMRVSNRHAQERDPGKKANLKEALKVLQTLK